MKKSTKHQFPMHCIACKCMLALFFCFVLLKLNCDVEASLAISINAVVQIELILMAKNLSSYIEWWSYKRL